MVDHPHFEHSMKGASVVCDNIFKLLLALLLRKHHIKTSKFSLKYFHLHCSHNATVILINMRTNGKHLPTTKTIDLNPFSS